MKKLLMLILIFVLVLTGCTSAEETDSSKDVEVNKEAFPIVDEEINLSMMAPGTGLAEWKDMPTLKEYSDKTNINFDYITPPMSDFQTKLNLAFASGDVADIIYGAGSSNLTPGMEVDYGQQGVLVPLEDLINEYAPNLKKILDENPEIKKSITTVDGHIYTLPAINQLPNAAWYRGPMWYNGEWMDALGVKELPKTTDELYDLLVRFKTEDPNGNGKADEIPLTDVKMDSTRPWLLGAFGLKEWGIDEVDGTVRYTPMTENYKEYLTYMNKLYEEELLDPETFSQSDEQKKAKGQENRLGLFPDYFSYFTLGQSPEEAINNPMFHPLTSSVSKTALFPRSPGISRGTFAITSGNKYPEASMRWVDYFYSKEGREYLNDGPEGLLWEKEDDGTRTYTDVPEGFDSREDYRGTLTPAYGIPVPTVVDKIEGVEVTEFDKFIENETKEKIDPYAEVPIPLMYLTKDEQTKVNTIEVDLQSYVEQMEAKFITGVEPLSNWDKYVQTIESMNIEEYVQVYQKAYDRWEDS